MRYLYLTALTFAMMAGCSQAPPEKQPVQQAPIAALPGPATAQHTVYDVVAAESLLQIKVYRGGPLARFGHNHVIGGPVLTGQVAVADDLSESRVSLSIDLASMQVDLPQWRRQAGDDFTSVPSEDDIAGTRENMLGPKVLDVASYPEAHVEIAGILGAAPDFSVLARITLKGGTRSLPVPVHLETSAGKIVASGKFKLTQSDFGLEPFSVLLGALSVQDELDILYSVVATASK